MASPGPPRTETSAVDAQLAGELAGGLAEGLRPVVAGPRRSGPSPGAGHGPSRGAGCPPGPALACTMGQSTACSSSPIRAAGRAGGAPTHSRGRRPPSRRARRERAASGRKTARSPTRCRAWSAFAPAPGATRHVEPERADERREERQQTLERELVGQGHDRLGRLPPLTCAMSASSSSSRWRKGSGVRSGSFWRRAPLS